MKNLPKIKITKEDLIKKELEVFLNFLNNPQYPQNRNKIFQAFPDLKSGLNTVDEKQEKEIIYQFISDFYKKNKEKIDLIIKQSEDLIQEKGETALKELFDLMDYEWPKDLIYNAVPTILPFSPFQKNSFNFSILGKLYGKNEKDVLYIAIHEISHFIFYDLLEKLGIKIEEDVKNYFKEALTVVLLNEEPLRSILELHDYVGNPEIRDIQIQKKDGAILKLVDFIKEYYQRIKITEGKEFNAFLKEILNIIISVSDDLSEKRKIWNTYGNQIFKDDDLLKQYRISIKIS